VALLGAVSFCAFLLASAVLGVRLLLLARRTRELPELAIAVAFLAAGVVGYGLMVICMVLHAVPEDVARPLRFVYVLGLDAGGLAVAWFVRRVFRNGTSWAGWLFAVIAAVFAAGFVGTTLSPPSPAGEAPKAFAFWPNTIGSVACYAWASFEAGRYYTLMRRRVRLGLADPIVTHRLLLWSVAAGTTVTTSLLFVAARFLEGGRPRPDMLVATYLLLIVGAGANWLVFFPPSAYTRRLRRTAEALS
jgi:hypothetical protein